mmetsp:Transcript_172439/g.419366  ORF Transcript_172439/g.419366 Transcript_172439/m.419366 type:complete len:261 (+) Transcript_172439:44-826(+)
MLPPSSGGSAPIPTAVAATGNCTPGSGAAGAGCVGSIAGAQVPAGPCLAGCVGAGAGMGAGTGSGALRSSARTSVTCRSVMAKRRSRICTVFAMISRWLCIASKVCANGLGSSSMLIVGTAVAGSSGSRQPSAGASCCGATGATAALAVLPELPPTPRPSGCPGAKAGEERCPWLGEASLGSPQPRLLTAEPLVATWEARGWGPRLEGLEDTSCAGLVCRGPATDDGLHRPGLVAPAARGTPAPVPAALAGEAAPVQSQR